MSRLERLDVHVQLGWRVLGPNVDVGILICKGFTPFRYAVPE